MHSYLTPRAGNKPAAFHRCSADDLALNPYFSDIAANPSISE